MITDPPDYQKAIDDAYIWMASDFRDRDDKVEYLRALKDEQTAFRVVSVLMGDYSKVSSRLL